MEFYHVLNRGVDKRDIFLDDSDRARFVHDIWEFNDKENANNVFYRASQNKGLRNHYIPKEYIVNLHGWCLMNNHYHLLLSERVEGGLTKFIRRLNVGYANYFNERYERGGALFQGRTKKILIKGDPHFLHILHYIHLNPLDFETSTKDWRAGSIKSISKALTLLSEYKWSSYHDYCKRQNFPSILTTEFFDEVFGNYKKRISSYIKDLDTEIIGSYKLE